MEILVYAGVLISLIGLAGLIWCIVVAARIKKSGLPQEEIQGKFQRLVAMNMGSLFLSVVGLMCVVVGIIL